MQNIEDNQNEDQPLVDSEQQPLKNNNSNNFANKYFLHSIIFQLFNFILIIFIIIYVIKNNKEIEEEIS